VRGYLLIPSAIQCIVQGDAAGGHAAFSQAAEIASRFDDPDLASLARHGRGRALIQLGDMAEGVALLDEAMVAVIAGDVAPILAGDIYCSVLEACLETFDLRRAYEWTTSLAQWCGGQPDLVRYRGECLLSSRPRASPSRCRFAPGRSRCPRARGTSRSRTEAIRIWGRRRETQKPT